MQNQKICPAINDNAKSECDSDTDDSEKCWREKHKGDSRKWLLRDASHFLSHHDPICSTMKDSYRYIRTQDEISEEIGHKRELLLKQFKEEAIDEILEECQKPPTIEEYCTEYDRTFYIKDYNVDDEFFKRENEMNKKYPLYSSIPTSYYSYKLVKQHPKEILHGFTTVHDNNNPFRKWAKFSKPIHEDLDHACK